MSAVTEKKSYVNQNTGKGIPTLKSSAEKYTALDLSFLAFLLTFLIVCVCVFCLGCGSTGKNKGGKSDFKNTSAGETNQFGLQQPENPAATANQNFETVLEETRVIPAGTVTEEKVATVEATPAGPKTNVTTRTITSPAPITNTVRKTTKAAASIGPSQHDDSKALAASFSALRPVQYVGIALILGALALAYFQWWTKAAICGATGIGMIVVAAIIPGNEGLILGVGGAIVAVGCLLVLYVYHKGRLDHLLPDSLDKNKNTQGK